MFNIGIVTGSCVQQIPRPPLNPSHSNPEIPLYRDLSRRQHRTIFLDETLDRLSNWDAMLTDPLFQALESVISVETPPRTMTVATCGDQTLFFLCNIATLCYTDGLYEFLF